MTAANLPLMPSESDAPVSHHHPTAKMRVSALLLISSTASASLVHLARPALASSSAIVTFAGAGTILVSSCGVEPRPANCSTFSRARNFAHASPSAPGAVEPRSPRERSRRWHGTTAAVGAAVGIAARSKCPRSQEPLRPHSSRGPCACPGRQVDAEREAPLCCSPKLTHLSTAVPQDTVPHHLRSVSRRGRHCMAPQEGLQSSQRRWRATAARYRRGRGAVQGVLAHTLRRPCPRTPRRDPSSVLCPTARASPLISIPSVAPRGERTRCRWTRAALAQSYRSTPLCLARAARG